MTVAELYRTLAAGGVSTYLLILAAPVAVGVLAWLVRAAGKVAASQQLCNAAVALGFTGVVVEVAALFYAARHHHVDILEDVELVQLALAPLFTIEALVIEHLLHPGPQAGVRVRIRSALLVVIVLGVFYFILQRLNMHMIIWSGMLGFLLFIAVIIAVLYYAMRRVV